MSDLNIADSKHEWVALRHISNVAKDFTNVMNDSVIGMDPSYFYEMCRDFTNVINDSPNLNKSLKDDCQDVLMNDVKKDGTLIAQGEEFKKFVNFVDATADHIQRMIVKRSSKGD